MVYSSRTQTRACGGRHDDPTRARFVLVLTPIATLASSGWVRDTNSKEGCARNSIYSSLQWAEVLLPDPAQTLLEGLMPSRRTKLALWATSTGRLPAMLRCSCPSTPSVSTFCIPMDTPAIPLPTTMIWVGWLPLILLGLLSTTGPSIPSDQPQLSCVSDTFVVRWSGKHLNNVFL